MSDLTLIPLSQRMADAENFAFICLCTWHEFNAETSLIPEVSKLELQTAVNYLYGC